MSSLKRIIASRANGARSRGPVTPEGKRHSSQNALRHGLLTRRVVLDDESREDFEALLAQRLHGFRPVDDFEFAAVQEMVAAYWRLCRARASETRLIDNCMAQYPEGHLYGRMAAAVGALAASGSLGLVHRYEARLQRIYERALRNLLLLRAAESRNARDRNSGLSAPANLSSQNTPLRNEPTKLLKTQAKANRREPFPEEPNSGPSAPPSALPQDTLLRNEPKHALRPPHVRYPGTLEAPL